MTPKNAYMTAKGYLLSAQTIHNNPAKPPYEIVFLSVHMLLAFSIELYLKAFLLHHGSQERELRSRQLGHSLESLFGRAQLAGLSVPRLDELIEVLHEPHYEFRYRYVEETDVFRRTNLDLAFSILNALDAQIDSVIGASSEYGLQPGH